MDNSDHTAIPVSHVKRNINPAVNCRKALESRLHLFGKTEAHLDFMRGVIHQSVLTDYQRPATVFLTANYSFMSERLWQMNNGGEKGHDQYRPLFSKPRQEDVLSFFHSTNTRDFKSIPQNIPSGKGHTVSEHSPNSAKPGAELNKGRTGRPLDISLRESLEPKFGFDLSKVRIHSGGDIAMKVGKANADAVTHGHDIYFASGKLDTGSRKGRALLVHELTHVFQHLHVPRTVIQSSPHQLQQFENDAQINEIAEYQNLTYLPVTQKKMTDFASKQSDNISPVQSAPVNRNVIENPPVTTEAIDTPTSKVDMEDDSNSLCEEAYNLLKYKLKIEKERMGS